MAIRGQEENSTLSLGGITFNNLNELYTSQLHNEYSINGNPHIPGKPSYSSLDLNGVTPEGYMDNPPT